MDDQPMWSQDPSGNYCLVFPNKNALSKDEIKKIFEKFGKVKAVTAAGDERGHRFVQFSTLEEVERAVEGIKNHETIRLIPHRPKNNKNNRNSNAATKSEQNDKPKSDNDNKGRNFFQRKSVNKENVTINNKTNSDTEHHVLKRTSNNNLISVYGSETKNLDYDLNADNASIRTNSFSLKKNITESDSQKYDLNHQTSPAKHLSIASPKSSSSASRMQRLLEKKGVYSEAHSNDTHSLINSVYEDEIPDLVTKKKVGLCKESKKIILNAEEVIVANIHVDYGSAYILHLFEKFDPLAISYIRVLSKTKIRYCHVYFKTVNDSMGVETLFDKHNIEGKNLVVLRMCRLMEEATS